MTLNPSDPFDPQWWQALEQTDSQAFFSLWVDVLRRRQPWIREAALVLGPANTGPFRPVCLLPAEQPPADALVEACEQVMQVRTVVQRSTAERTLLALPVQRSQDLYGVIALAGEGAPPAALREELKWGLGWLLLRLSARVDEASERLHERLLTALDLMLSALEELRWQAASQAAVTELAQRLGCDRVSVGFGDGRNIRFAALSHSADFSRHIDLVRQLEAAMNEAADQGEPIEYSRDTAADAADSGLRINLAHRELALHQGNSLIRSVPFLVSERAYGVFLFEWQDAQVDPVSAQLAATLPAIIGRVLLEKREQQLPPHKRLARAFRGLLERLFGPRHAIFKLVTLALLGAGLFLYLAHDEFRLAARATLEGGTIRVVTSPYDAYVASASVRAGQTVQEGQQLATLDDREMRLEASRWASQQRQYERQLHDAEAQHNLAQVQVARAQVQQAAAELELIRQQMQRAVLRAPFDGVVVNGDLSQQLGSAVRKGDRLFEVAPLDDYRVELLVDEQDMAYVQPGQRGSLMLTALPGQPVEFEITLVTPVARATEGRNSFRVEASLTDNLPAFRPGMEGVGRIAVGERRLAWIWSRRTLDWARIQLWKWFGL